MDNQWETPGTGAGEPPDDALAVARAVWEDAQRNALGYLFSGIAITLVMMVVSFLLIGMAVAVTVPLAAVAGEDETMSGLFVLAAIGMYSFVILIIVAISPLFSASLLRAIDAARGGGSDGVMWSSGFDTALQDAGRIIGFALIGVIATLTGFAFCFIPGLLVSALWSFAFPILVLERVSPIEAVQAAFRHMSQHATWHLGVWLIAWLVLAVLQATGVGGIFAVPFLVAYQVYAYRTAFGETGASAVAL